MSMAVNTWPGWEMIRVLGEGSFGDDRDVGVCRISGGGMAADSVCDFLGCSV